MSNGVNGSSTVNDSSESRNPSQRYLSTRGEDYDVWKYDHYILEYQMLPSLILISSSPSRKPS